MVFIRVLCVLVIFFSAVVAHAETPLLPQLVESKNQYEINSETVYFSDSELLQTDLRLLVGRKLNGLRLAVGGYGLYQESEMFDASYRHGPMAQAKLNLWRNWLFFVYEYHFFKMRNVDGNLHENRYGLYGGYYYEISEKTSLDFYAESFHIPTVSKGHLLSTGRASIYRDTHLDNRHVLDLLLEVYTKDSPPDWGGSRTDLRAGIKFQPRDFVSAKIFWPIVSSEDDATAEWQGQINIYKVGDF